MFYSKEDPVNYEAFIGLARKCEYVFTTAVEKIESYQKDCRHNNIFVLEFGVNPLYHNPIGIKIFKKVVMFSLRDHGLTNIQKDKRKQLKYLME